MANTKIETNVPSVHLSDLEKIVNNIKQVTEQKDVEITFEFIIASLFPTSWEKIQAELNHQYTKGYIQGRKDEEAESRAINRAQAMDDVDCYCE